MRFSLPLLLLFVHTLLAQRDLGVSPTGSGGPLMPEQAAYDVTYYDISLRVLPAEEAIEGAVTVYARVVHPLEYFVLDLDTLLAVSAVSLVDHDGVANPLLFERRGWKLWSLVGRTMQPGELVRIRVEYGGRPRVSPRPPWVGGFTWARTPSGEPWVGVSCQNDGADIWWPCKDHPSDRADSVAINVTVPQSLVCASNGRLRGVTPHDDGTHTYHWFVSTPINNYCVNIIIAPYMTVAQEYLSVTGERFPVTFWVLPENEERGKKHLELFVKDLRFLEERLGPYPFRADKYGVVETPYLGMEHQTIIAYGNNFQVNHLGYDWLHFHELAHEWWANLVSNADWKDFWIHEGFATYMEALYIESLAGDTAYHRFMGGIRNRQHNIKPVAPTESSTTTEIYFLPPDFTRSDTDVYFKGAWILHTLRYLIGTDAFNTFLRRMAYPTPELEAMTDGSQCRYATTEDVIRTAETVSGQPLRWFFDLYLRQPTLPKLHAERRGRELHLWWEVPEGFTFAMPVEVELARGVVRVEMPDGRGSVRVPPGVVPRIDPKRWILKVEE